MGVNYCTVQDIAAYGRALSAAEEPIAEKFITSASSKLRLIAKQADMDIDRMITDDEDYGQAVNEIVSRSVIRALNSVADNAPPAVQSSQAALGYSVSMTYLNSGQAEFFLKNELKELGILRQRVGVVRVYDDGSNDEN